jgi:hypothetical protein
MHEAGRAVDLDLAALIADKMFALPGSAARYNSQDGLRFFLLSTDYLSGSVTDNQKAGGEMRLRSQIEGLAVPAIITSVLTRDAIVAVTGNRTVDKAGANAVAIGRLSKPAREAGGSGTVETRFKELIEINADGLLAAGDVVKLSAADGAGNQRVKKWTGQTDTVAGDKPESIFGICWNGGADGAVVEVLVR